MGYNDLRVIKEYVKNISAMRPPTQKTNRTHS